jgi:hypothetical protein
MTEEAYGNEFEKENSEGSMWGGFKDMFSTGSEYENMTADEFQYERKLFDRKIEAFLDRNFTDYARDFGILDEVALEMRNVNLSVLENRSEGLVSFIGDIDKEVSILENKVSTLAGALKKK